MKSWTITQYMRYEFGRASALPYHQPSHVKEITVQYVSHEYCYAITGSGFQLINGESVYVTYGEYTAVEND